MIELHELSPIGFGGYRIESREPLHRDALVAALDAGCTLIDTAANYGNGDSERVIGSVLAETRRDAFVITKAGYVDGENLHILGDACRRGLPVQAIGRMAQHTLYCIHPAYLQAQMEESRRRLHRGVLDALLLHNPEHILGSMTREEMLASIRTAFSFLEECVAQGGLRFYGISSNAFDTALLAELPPLPHFRFLEMPLNLVEQSARSTFAAARARGLITLANRPLNAMTPNGPVRLTTDEGDPGDTAAIVENAMTRMRRRLHDAGEDDFTSFEVLRILATRIENLGTSDAVDALFTTHFFPLVDALDDLAEEGDAEAFRALHETAIAHAKRHNALAARAIRVRAEEEGLLDQDERPLPLVAIERLFSWGADHVLCGMRRPEYVKQLEELFRCAVAS